MKKWVENLPLTLRISLNNPRITRESPVNNLPNEPRSKPPRMTCGKDEFEPKDRLVLVKVPPLSVLGHAEAAGGKHEDARDAVHQISLGGKGWGG